MDSGEAAGLLHLFCDKHVTYHRVYRAEEAGLPDPDTLWLTTADGFRIHTLEVKPEGEVKGAVICISGIENPSVTAFYGHAREFREIGLTTLMPDLRGHGDSDGDRICLAYNETADIKAVTEYVKATYTDIPVIVMGLSMGGGVAIRSIGENDDIDALITLSASAGVCQECLRTTSNAGRNSRSVRRRHAQGLHGRPSGRWR